MRHQCREVGLRAAREEQAGFLARAFGKDFLQAPNRRVVAPDVVTHVGNRHCRAHRLARTRHRVATQIDDVVLHVLSSGAFLPTLLMWMLRSDLVLRIGSIP